jgi:hypothetical protein
MVHLLCQVHNIQQGKVHQGILNHCEIWPVTPPAGAMIAGAMIAANRRYHSDAMFRILL